MDEEAPAPHNWKGPWAAEPGVSTWDSPKGGARTENHLSRQEAGVKSSAEELCWGLQAPEGTRGALAGQGALRSKAAASQSLFSVAARRGPGIVTSAPL